MPVLVLVDDARYRSQKQGVAPPFLSVATFHFIGCVRANFCRFSTMVSRSSCLLRVHCPSLVTLVAFVQRADKNAFLFLTCLYFFLKCILHCHCIFQFMGKVRFHVLRRIGERCLFFHQNNPSVFLWSSHCYLQIDCFFLFFFFTLMPFFEKVDSSLGCVTAGALRTAHFYAMFFALCLKAGPRLVLVYCWPRNNAIRTWPLCQSSGAMLWR